MSARKFCSVFLLGTFSTLFHFFRQARYGHAIVIYLCQHWYHFSFVRCCPIEVARERERDREQAPCERMMWERHDEIVLVLLLDIYLFLLLLILFTLHCPYFLHFAGYWYCRCCSWSPSCCQFFFRIIFSLSIFFIWFFVRRFIRSRLLFGLLADAIVCVCVSLFAGCCCCIVFRTFAEHFCDILPAKINAQPSQHQFHIKTDDNGLKCQTSKISIPEIICE